MLKGPHFASQQHYKIPFTLGFKAHLGQSDHNWTANTSLNKHQNPFKTHSLKPLVRVVWEAFDYIFVV